MPSRDAHNGRLDEEGQRRMDDGEVAIRSLAEGDTPAGVKQVAQIPKDGDLGVLPEDEACCDEEQHGGRNSVAASPANQADKSDKAHANRSTRQT
jgi:hypothetical protein